MQKTTKITEEDRLVNLPEMKAQIRRNDPNLSSQQVERKALEAVGLDPGPDPKSVKLDEIPEGGRGRAAARKVGEGASRAKVVVTSTGARKTIVGVLLLGLAIGVLRDIQSGAAIRTDVIPRRIIGTFLSALLLMMLAGPLPRVARGLAFLVGFTIVALNQETIASVAGTVDESSEGVERVTVTTGGSGGSPNKPI
jgi:hypothetical protein